MKISKLIGALQLRYALGGDMDVKIHIVGTNPEDDPDLGCVFADGDEEILYLCDGPEIPNV